MCGGPEHQWKGLALDCALTALLISQSSIFLFPLRCFLLSLLLLFIHLHSNWSRFLCFLFRVFRAAFPVRSCPLSRRFCLDRCQQTNEIVTISDIKDATGSSRVPPTTATKGPARGALFLRRRLSSHSLDYLMWSRGNCFHFIPFQSFFFSLLSFFLSFFLS